MQRLMRHMRRVIFVVCVGVVALPAALWVRSYWRVDSLSYNSADAPDGTQWGVGGWSDSGSIIIHFFARQNPVRGMRPPPGFAFSSYVYVPKSIRSFGPRAPLETKYGFGYREENIPSYFVTAKYGGTVAVQAYRWRTIGFPYAVPIILCAMYPIMQFRRRRREGCCAKCGYDLRASPERCPECGLVTASAAA